MKYENVKDLLGEEGIRKYGNALIENINFYGLGVLSKADFEAFLYYLIDTYKKADAELSDFELSTILRVTPSKLRSMQTIASVRYKNLDDSPENWELVKKALLKTNVEIEDCKKGTVRVYVSDVHVIRFIQKFAVDNQSSDDRTLNANQVVLKYEVFLKMLTALKEKTAISDNEIEKSIADDTSYKKVEKELSSPKSILKDLTDRFKSKSLDKIAEEGLKLVTETLISILKKRIGL